MLIHVYLHQEDRVLILIWVDDIILSTKSVEKMHIFKNLLKAKFKFKMKDLGTINHFLGIRIVQQEKSVELDQSVYINC